MSIHTAPLWPCGSVVPFSPWGSVLRFRVFVEKYYGNMVVSANRVVSAFF